MPLINGMIPASRFSLAFGKGIHGEEDGALIFDKTFTIATELAEVDITSSFLLITMDIFPQCPSTCVLFSVVYNGSEIFQVALNSNVTNDSKNDSLFLSFQIKNPFGELQTTNTSTLIEADDWTTLGIQFRKRYLGVSTKRNQTYVRNYYGIFNRAFKFESISKSRFYFGSSPNENDTLYQGKISCFQLFHSYSASMQDDFTGKCKLHHFFRFNCRLKLS